MRDDETDPRVLAEQIRNASPHRRSGSAIERDGTVVYYDPFNESEEDDE